MSQTTEANSLSYEVAGVDINKADAAKREMAKSMKEKNPRVLNSLGAFASLYDINFPEITEPVMVIKMEEPGSKQLLAAQYGMLPNVGYDLVNHLINDTICVGARPLAVQDTIVCGLLEPETVVALVDKMADACRKQNCDLVGGETSEQPGVLPNGSYILSAACVGIVDKKQIISGSEIKAGQKVFAVASNGVHTNGYTLVRKILENKPQLAETKIQGIPVIEHLLKAHLCYNLPLQNLFKIPKLISGIAHITGGGVVDNLKRILPHNVNANLDLSKIKILEIFKTLKDAGNVPTSDMLRTFNLGAGMLIVADQSASELLVSEFERENMSVYEIGEISAGTGAVITINSLNF